MNLTSQHNPYKTDTNNLYIGAAKDTKLNRSGGREMKNLLVCGLFTVLSVLMVACGPDTSVQVNTPSTTMQLKAPGPNPMVNQPDGSGLIARAGAGLWHGLIAPVTLVISFFNSDVHMYEVHNAGSEYDLGFLLGVTIIIALLSLFARMRR